jgi:hypothetical protein
MCFCYLDLFEYFKAHDCHPGEGGDEEELSHPQSEIKKEKEKKKYNHIYFFQKIRLFFVDLNW